MIKIINELYPDNNKRFELINGIIYEKPPHTKEARLILDSICQQFKEYFENDNKN